MNIDYNRIDPEIIKQELINQGMSYEDAFKAKQIINKHLVDIIKSDNPQLSELSDNFASNFLSLSS